MNKSDQHRENLVRLESRKRRLNSIVIIYRFVFYILLFRILLSENFNFWRIVVYIALFHHVPMI